MGSQVSLSEPLSVQTSQFYSSLWGDTDSINSRTSVDKTSPHTAKAKGMVFVLGSICDMGSDILWVKVICRSIFFSDLC